jgi:RNA polymerase-binding transcription factor DksA
MASYEDLRAELVTRIDILSRRADNIEADLRKPRDRDWVERASEIENDEVLDSLDEVTRAEVAELRHAVQRIDNGTYGRCEHCGGAISYARLEALPWTAKCVRCASAVQ